MLHVLYGTVAGGAFGALSSFLDVPDPDRPERASLIGGLVYGVVLSVVGSRVVFVRVLGRKLRSEDALVFHVGHVIYGLTLGTFLATRERVGEVYRESEPTRPPSEKQRTTQ